MPEFMMENRDECAREESAFVLGFIKAMFFTSVCSDLYDSENWFDAETQSAVSEGQADGCLPCDVGYADLHPDSLAAIRAFCVDWQAKAAALLVRAYDRPDYDETAAGRDLWFSSQGHGVGFWDRTPLDADGLGDALHDLAKHQEISPFYGDHVTYGNAPFVHVDL